MQEILITTGLMLVVVYAILALNKLLPFRVCAICAGVSGAWVLITAGILTGQLPITRYQLPVAILMGGTVVGIAYQGEKTFEWVKRNSMRFKTVVIFSGFFLAYFALNSISWTVFVLEIAVLGTVAWLYFVMPEKMIKDLKDTARIKEIEEKLKNCC